MQSYMIKVLKPRSEAGNFSEFRAEVLHHTKGSSLHNINLTSNGILAHIKRSLYNAYNMMQCLDIQLDKENVLLPKPEDHGYEYEQDELIPATSWKTLEPRWSVSCNCTKCARSSCQCRMAGVKCGRFCQCKKTSLTVCKNPVT